MKSRTISICVFATGLSVSIPAYADDCKPDVSRTDKISKQQENIWRLFQLSPSLGDVLLNTSSVTTWATIGRYGNVNALNIQIRKTEDSAANAAFESAYRAAIGKQFHFGFKSGDPVSFVVTAVGNEAKVRQYVVAAQGETNALLSATVSDKDLATLRNALTTRQIDAVRIELGADVRIEKSVDDGSGKKMMAQLSCFYQFLDKAGIDLAAVSQPAAPRSPQPTVQPSGSNERPLTNADVVALAKLDLGDDTVVLKIQQAPIEALDVSTDGLVALRAGGVSKAVIDAMIKRAAQRR